MLRHRNFDQEKLADRLPAGGDARIMAARRHTDERADAVPGTATEAARGA